MSCVSGSAAYLRQQVIDKCTNWTGTFRGDVTLVTPTGVNVTNFTFTVAQDADDVKTGRWQVDISGADAFDISGAFNISGYALAFTFCDGTFVLEGITSPVGESTEPLHFQLVAICQCCNRVANANVNLQYLGNPATNGFGHLNLLTLH
jgi:hypothetical protein